MGVSGVKNLDSLLRKERLKEGRRWRGRFCPFFSRLCVGVRACVHVRVQWCARERARTRAHIRVQPSVETGARAFGRASVARAYVGICGVANTDLFARKTKGGELQYEVDVGHGQPVLGVAIAAK